MNSDASRVATHAVAALIRDARGSLRTSLSIAAASALLWSAAIYLEEWLLPDASHARVDLLLIAPGVRFLVLLIGGAWAAIGISGASFVLFVEIFDLTSTADIVALSLLAGFAPYLSLIATMRLVKVDRNLTNLSPYHLPMISLGVAAGSAVMHASLLWILEEKSLQEVLGVTLAMATADFVASLIVIFLVLIGIHFRHWLKT